MRTIILISLMFVSVFSFAQQERKHIRQGNREYEKAKIDSVSYDTIRFQNAEVDYRKAIEKSPNNWDALYNLGNSLFKQGKYDEAVKQFQAVAGMDNQDKKELAMAYHNLGNSLLKTNKLQEAIDAYKDALRNNPTDMETKYNLAWAQNKLNEQQNQQQQNKDNQNNDQQEQDDSENKQDNKQNNDQQDEQKQNQEQQNQEQQNQEQQNQEQQNQEQQQKEQQQQQQPQQNKISKEDAMRILEALQNDEKEVQDKVQKQKAKAQKRMIEKDW